MKKNNKIKCNPLIKLVDLMKGKFTFDTQYIYITIPFEQFVLYVETWERLNKCEDSKK